MLARAVEKHFFDFDNGISQHFPAILKDAMPCQLDLSM